MGGPGAGGGGPGPQYVQVTPEEKEAIDRVRLSAFTRTHTLLTFCI